jgi:hypothetical protein
MTPLCMTPPRHLPEMLRPVTVERDPPSQATPGGMNLTKGLRPGPFLQSLLSEGEGGDAYDGVSGIPGRGYARSCI